MLTVLFIIVGPILVIYLFPRIILPAYRRWDLGDYTHPSTTRTLKHRSGYYLPDKVVNYHEGEEKLRASYPKPTQEGYLVIGVGFVGSWLVRHLVERGERNIIAADINKPKLSLPDTVEFLRLDVRSYKDVQSVFDHAQEIFEKKGTQITTVYTTMAIIRAGNRLDFQLSLIYSVNFTGIENIISACRRPDSTIRYLIYTSTSGVVAGYDNPTATGADESTPFTTQPYDHYNMTKTLAEKLVVSSNGTSIPNTNSKLWTISIRPSGAILGAHDTFTIDLFYKQSLAHSMIPQPSFKHVKDYVYVENVSLGLMLGEFALRSKPFEVGGHAFFVSNDDPISGGEMASRARYFFPELSPVTQLHPVVTYLLGAVSETVQKISRGKISLGPLDNISPAIYYSAYRDDWHSVEKAKSMLGYSPAFTSEQGIQKSFALMKSEYK